LETTKNRQGKIHDVTQKIHAKFLRNALCGSGKNSLKFLYPRRDPDHQNLISCCESHISTLQKN